MSDRYIERDGQPVPEPDLFVWARWFETANRHVARDVVGPAEISTVFLGLDHGFWGRPALYETMVFWRGHPLDQECVRYSTREEAVAGHEEMVGRVEAALEEG